MNHHKKKELREGLAQLTIEQRCDVYNEAEKAAQEDELITSSEFVYEQLYINEKSPYFLG